MNEITTINPDDARLTRQLVFESHAATAAHESTRIRNICHGTGVVVAAVGISLAALVWAWNQRTDPEMLKAALADLPPIQVEARLKDGEVTLADGAQVTIKDGATVGVNGTVALEPEASVTLDTAGIKLPIVPPSVATQPANTEDGTAIKRSVTVFSEVSVPEGAVVTGWVFPNGKATTPTDQYCYLHRPARDGVSEKVDLASNGKPLARSTALVALSSRCQWFMGGKV